MATFPCAPIHRWFSNWRVLKGSLTTKWQFNDSIQNHQAPPLTINHSSPLTIYKSIFFTMNPQSPWTIYKKRKNMAFHIIHSPVTHLGPRYTVQYTLVFHLSSAVISAWLMGLDSAKMMGRPGVALATWTPSMALTTSWDVAICWGKR